METVALAHGSVSAQSNRETTSVRSLLSPNRTSNWRDRMPADRIERRAYGGQPHLALSSEARWRELWLTVTPIWAVLTLSRILFYGLERLRHPDLIPPVWADAALSFMLLPLVVVGSYFILRLWQTKGLALAAPAALGSALLFGAAARPVHALISVHVFGHAGAQGWLAAMFASTSAFWESWLATTVEYGMLYLSSVFGAVGILSYRKLVHERLLRAWAEATADRERLRALRMQLNPHFLFNALNSIVGANYSDAVAAQELVARLGELLRQTLLASEREEHELREEMQVVENYVQMEQIRTNSSVKWSSHVDSACIRVAVPSLILLPLIENAVKHGLRGSAREVVIEMSVSHCGDSVLIGIVNTCLPLNEATDTLGPGGIGLRNVSERLRVLYGSRARLLTARPARSEFAAWITLPHRESDESLAPSGR